MTYQEFEKASKEGDIALLAQGQNHFQPRPRAAMIRYRTKPSGGSIADFATGIVSSSSKEKPTETPKNVDDELIDDPDYVPDSQEDKFDDEELLCDEDEAI